MPMDGRVRDLYKRFLIAGRNHPQGLSYIRDRVKAAFQANKNVANELEMRKCIGYGRYQVRELYALNALHKYRTLRKRYSPPS